MHELSLVVSLLDIVRQEMRTHGAEKLLLARVRYGALANVLPEALHMAFDSQTTSPEFAGARLELVEEPVRLACGACAREFSPGSSQAALFSPCPSCGGEIGHLVLAGRELYLDHLELE